jgi:hypothetical protein
MNPPSTRIRKRGASLQQQLDRRQTLSGRHDVFQYSVSQILMLDSVTETKLPTTIKAALSVHRSRAKTNTSPAWSDLTYACTNFESHRSIGATDWRLVVVVVFNEKVADTYLICQNISIRHKPITTRRGNGDLIDLSRPAPKDPQNALA